MQLISDSQAISEYRSQAEGMTRKLVRLQGTENLGQSGASESKVLLTDHNSANTENGPRK